MALPFGFYKQGRGIVLKTLIFVMFRLSLQILGSENARKRAEFPIGCGPGVAEAARQEGNEGCFRG
jgi:hypothetical protein